jgi:hypothetical protein
MWQDYVLTIGSVFFTVTLLPTCVDERTAMPRYKSVPTAFWLAVFAAVQWTMGLRVVPVCEVAYAACWAFIAWRRPLRARGLMLQRDWRERNLTPGPRFHRFNHDGIELE